MFLGHAALGLAAKRVAPRTSLGWLLIAPWLLDLLWPVFLITGIERVQVSPGVTAFTPLDFTWYPWSHSLAMTLVWSVLAGLLYRQSTRDGRGAVVIGGLVASHWFMDALVHRPDLPLLPGLGPRIGLGLWDSIPATLLLEGGTFALGLALYLGATRARDRRGHLALWALVFFLVGVYASSAAGPPPPNAAAVGWVTLALWAMIVPWALWVERHRAPRGAPGA